MSTTAAKQAGGNEKVDGGTVTNAGTPASDSPITDTMNPNELATGGSEYGSKVKANDGGDGGLFEDPQGVTTAKAAGTGGLAYSPARGERNFIIKAAGSEGAGKINNDASTLLTIPGAQYDSIGQDSIHRVASTRRVGASASASFDVLAVPSSGVVPGRTKGANAGDAQNFVQTGDGSTAATDQAASPTRAVPGELTYHFGGLGKATTDEYKAKDSNE